MESVSLVGSFTHKTGSWRLIEHLFQVPLGAIISDCLESLSKDRVERFVPVMGVEDVGDSTTHRKFHLLHRILGLSSQLEKVVINLTSVDLALEDSVRSHCSDRHRDGSEVKLARENRPASFTD
jgi:hypothetical protein